MNLKPFVSNKNQKYIIIKFGKSKILINDYIESCLDVKVGISNLLKRYLRLLN